MINRSKVILGSVGFCAIATQCLAVNAVENLAIQENSIFETSFETQLAPEDDSLLANAKTSVSELLSETHETSLEQLTSVSQLSDVTPTDWAFQALQSLVER